MKKIKKFSLTIVLITLFEVIFISSICYSLILKEKIHLKIGFSSEMFSGINMRDAKSAIDLYARDMVSIINKDYGDQYEVSTIVYNNRRDLTNAIKNKDVDFVATTTKEFIEIRDLFDLEPALINNRKDKLEYFVLLTNKEKNINNLADLKGKKLLVTTGGKGDLALNWLGVELLKNGLQDCDLHFSEIKRTDKQNQSIMPVFFGQADACITFNTSINEMTNLNPQISKKIITLNQSKNICYGLMFFTPGVDQKTKKIVNQTAKNLDNYPSGKQIIKLFQIPGVDHFNKNDIKPIEDILKDYKTLKNKKKK